MNDNEKAVLIEAEVAVWRKFLAERPEKEKHHGFQLMVLNELMAELLAKGVIDARELELVEKHLLVCRQYRIRLMGRKL